MRFRITQTTTIEYHVDPRNYSENGEILTPMQMLEIDMDNIREDPAVIHLLVNEDEEKIELDGRIID